MGSFIIVSLFKYSANIRWSKWTKKFDVNAFINACSSSFTIHQDNYVNKFRQPMFGVGFEDDPDRIRLVLDGFAVMS